MKTQSQLENRVCSLEQVTSCKEHPLAWMSDDDVKTRTREILVSHGYPEAATCSDQELMKFAKQELGK